TFAPPRPDGVVRALALSPDGRVLYLGGDFDGLITADGAVVNRPHVAALDAATGALSDWDPPRDTGGRYYGHAGTPDKSRAGGVYAIAPSADGTTVHVGGTFLSWAGHSGIVSLDAATARPTPWQARIDRPVFGLARSSDGHTFYAAAGGAGGAMYAFRPHGARGRLAGEDRRRRRGGGGDRHRRLRPRPLRQHRPARLELLAVLPRRHGPGAPLGLRPHREDRGLEPGGQHADRSLRRRRRRRPRLRRGRVHQGGRRAPRRVRGVLRDALIGLRVEAGRPAPEAPGGTRPERRVAAPVVEVPAGAAARRPHRAGHGPLDAGVPGGLGVVADLDDVARPAEVADGVEDIGDLRLDHEHLGAVAEAGVGADEQEQVGEAGHRRPLVGPHAAGPVPLQGLAAPAGDPVGDGDVGHVEARPEDDRVDRVFAAVGGHHRPGPDLGHAGGDEVDVGLRQG